MNEQQRNDRRKTQNNGQHSLVTERDIDPTFGLFTEEEAGRTIPDAAAELQRLKPDLDRDH